MSQQGALSDKKENSLDQTNRKTHRSAFTGCKPSHVHSFWRFSAPWNYHWNAHSSGVLTNMTIGEYEGAKKKQDSIVINVKHKTADTHSPACLVLSPTLFSYLQVYFKEVQSKVLDSTSNENESSKAYVFLSWMESGQICTAINAAGQKAKCKGTSHQLCFTSLQSQMCYTA